MKGVDLLVRPHATSRVSSSVTTVPNIAIADADLRVRTLDSASRKVASGAISSIGTAHGRAAAGSNMKPDPLVLDAAPAAGATLSADRAMGGSGGPPGRRSRGPGRR